MNNLKKGDMKNEAPPPNNDNNDKNDINDINSNYSDHIKNYKKNLFKFI